MIRVNWTDRVTAYENKYVEIPEKDIEDLLKRHPDYDIDDIKEWILDNIYNYETMYSDIYYDDDCETVGDMDIYSDEDLTDIINSFKEDSCNNEETDDAFIGSLGNDED